MFNRFISYLQFGNRYCGIEHSSKNGKKTLHVTVLKKAKKEVIIDDLFSSKSIGNLSKKLSKKQHAFLVINNEHVLTKSLDNESLESIKLVNKAFPNINMTEFYYEVIQQDTRPFISICRKSFVDELIKKYTDLGISIVNLSFGNSVISSVASYLKVDTISTSNASITVKNKVIETIVLDETIKEEQYNINGLDSSNTYLLSLSAALSSILNNYKSTTNFQEKKAILINSFKQIRFYSLFLKMGLVFILSVLLVNFLFFNFYYNGVNQLNETSQLNQTTKSKIITLNEKVSNAQKMTDDMLKSSVSKSSFYVNAIIGSLPESILLSEINYQPILKNIKKDKAIALNQNTIMVSGTSINSVSYSQWISVLETMNWINKVEVETYSDSKTTTSLFSLKISILP
ncbi:hypothetical protein [Changchengzhania lutea]|uniref:hypothetical protein n=1 Tax=Changchengzhania lutea TaxID=2049305 RepID=UPI00115D5024|nr:hypothetical protein [Changchengzhania lutea]